MTVSELTRQAIETHLVEGGKRRIGIAGRSGGKDIRSLRVMECLGFPDRNPQDHAVQQSVMETIHSQHIDRAITQLDQPGSDLE